MLITEINPQDYRLRPIGWAGRDIAKLYAQFQNLLRQLPDAAHLLAEPLVSETTIAYHTDNYREIKRFSELDENERQALIAQTEQIAASVQAQLQHFADSSNINERNFAKVLDNIFYIPNTDFLYRIDGRPVLIFWGYSDNTKPLDIRTFHSEYQASLPSPVPEPLQPTAEEAAAQPVSEETAARSETAIAAAAGAAATSAGVSAGVAAGISEPEPAPAFAEPPPHPQKRRRNWLWLLLLLLLLLLLIFGGLGYWLYVSKFQNKPPIAAADEATLNGADSQIAIDILANDSDPNRGDTLRIQSCEPQLTIDNGRVVYARQKGVLGKQSFTCTIADQDGLTASAPLNIDVLPQPLTASPIAAVLKSEDKSLGIDLSQYVQSPDGLSLSLGSCSGELTVDDGLNILYRRQSGSTGKQNLQCTVADSTGQHIDVPITIDVQPQPLSVIPVNLVLREADTVLDIDLSQYVQSPDGFSVNLASCSSELAITSGKNVRYTRGRKDGKQRLQCQFAASSGQKAELPITIDVVRDCRPIITKNPPVVTIAVDISNSMTHAVNISNSMTAGRPISRKDMTQTALTTLFAQAKGQKVKFNMLAVSKEDAIRLQGNSGPELQNALYSLQNVAGELNIPALLSQFDSIIQENPKKRNVFVFITDATDSLSEEYQKEYQRAIDSFKAKYQNNKNVRVSIIHIGEAYTAGYENMAIPGSQRMIELSDSNLLQLVPALLEQSTISRKPEGCP